MISSTISGPSISAIPFAVSVYRTFVQCSFKSSLDISFELCWNQAALQICPWPGLVSQTSFAVTFITLLKNVTSSLLRASLTDSPAASYANCLLVFLSLLTLSSGSMFRASQRWRPWLSTISFSHEALTSTIHLLFHVVKVAVTSCSTWICWT